jgi:exodeoxyribonuclease VII small subunit
MSETDRNNRWEHLKELPFEQAMERLEEVVDRLENGDVPLEEAIQLYEEGMRLSRICGEKLDKVEQQIEMLVQENGEWVKKPFQPEEDSE